MNFFWAKIPFLVKIHLTQNNQTKEQAAHEFVHECRTQLCQKFKYVSRMKLNSVIARSIERTAQSPWHMMAVLKKPNMNKCFGIQLKLHDISWWLARIFIHVQWTMDFIYLWQQKKKLHAFVEIASVKWYFLLRFGLFFTSPIQSIENKTLEHS